MRLRFTIVSGILSILTFSVVAQNDDLLSMIPDSAITNYVTGSFKTDHVINLHSLENTAAGELDIKISHRFSDVNRRIYNLFGLDGPASLRIGGDYGITDRLNVGVGRNNIGKTYDGFVKFKLLRQSTGAKKMPITFCVLGTMAIVTDSTAVNGGFFTNKLFYTGQLIIGRKFSKLFSLQLSPTIVHRNIVATDAEKNDVLALGAGARFKLGKRTSLNAEYIYVLPDQIDPQYRNSLSLGFDVETGGHVFQMFFTNSHAMIEKGFITETSPAGDGNIAKGIGDFQFGFNLSRTFNIK